MNNLKLSYSIATLEDLDSVVALHKKVFINNSTTLLGSSFLYQYYRLFLNENFFFLVAKKQEKTVGFIVGVNDYKLLSKCLKKNAHLFLIPILRSVFNINLIPFLVKRLFAFIFNDRVNKMPLNLKNHNEITSFAVDNDYQNLGIGTSILNKYLSLVSDDTIQGVFLTTNATDNRATINFYKKSGFLIKHTYHQTKNRRMHLMLRRISYESTKNPTMEQHDFIQTTNEIMTKLSDLERKI